MKQFLKYLSGKDCYGSSKVADRNIIYTAAYLNNLCRDYVTLERSQKRPLLSIAMKFDIYPEEIEENFQKLIDLSNIDAVDRKISQDIVSKYKDYLMSDISQSYDDLNEELKKYFVEIQANNQKILETSNQNIQEIRAKYDAAKKDLDKITEYKEQLKEVMNLVREDTERRVQSLCDQLKDLVKD